MSRADNLAALGSNVTTAGNLSSESTLTLQTNSTTAITIDSSQNVGIGTNGTNGTSSRATSASGYFTGSGLKSISSTFTGGGGTIATFIALYIV